MKKRITGLILVFVFLSISFSSSQADQNADVQALAKFLMNRANENYLYAYKKSIRNNSFIKHYFINTDRMLNRISFDALITSQELLKKCIKDDLQNMLFALIKDVFTDDGYYRFVFPDAPNNKKTISEFIACYTTCDKTGDSNTVGVESEKKIKYLNSTRIYQSALFYEQFRSSGNSDESSIILFNNDLCSVLKDINSIIQKLAGIQDIKDINVKRSNIEPCIEKMEALIAKYSSKQDLQDDEQFIYNIKVIKKINYLFSAIVNIGKNVEVIKNDIRMDNISIINYLLSFFDEFEIKSNSKITCKYNYLAKFKKFALFMTLLSETNTADEKLALINAYILPPVSFEGKRNGSFNFSISSYLGGTLYYSNPMDYSDSFEKDDYQKYRIGFFAPVGFEYSMAFDSEIIKSCGFSSFGCLLSIVDVGEVVNSQLYNRNKTFNYQDVIYPGLFCAIGFNELPISLGIGARYHSAEFDDERIREGQALFFIAFDMPLFAIY